MVDGAAGSGKSCTINILKEYIQSILQQSGDNVDCPHVLVCAPTGMNNNISQILNLTILCPGTADVNINGQTLYSTLDSALGMTTIHCQTKRETASEQHFKIFGFL